MTVRRPQPSRAGRARRDTAAGTLAAAAPATPLFARQSKTLIATAAFLATEGVATTTQARADDLSLDALIPAVLVVGEGADPVLLERLVHPALPGSRGVGLLFRSVGQLSPDAARVIISADDQVDIPHIGITAHAAGLAPDELGQGRGSPDSRRVTLILPSRSSG